MENYAKVILYTYPLLRTVGKDYADHIRNKAVLSYESSWGTEKLAEYLAEEILRKERLEWLKSVVDEILGELNDWERDLVNVRYFAKGRKRAQARCRENMSEREYFRRQQRLAEKLNKMLREKGVTKEIYLRDFAVMDIFEKIHRFVEEGRDKKRVGEEWRLG